MNKARLLGFGILTLMGLIIAPFWLSPSVPPSMQTDAMKKAELEKDKPKPAEVKPEPTANKQETTLSLTSYQNQDHEGNALPVLAGDSKEAEKPAELVYSREPVVKAPKTSGLSQNERDLVRPPAIIENPRETISEVKKPETVKTEVVKKAEPKKESSKRVEPKKEVVKKESLKKPEPKKEAPKLVKKEEPKKEPPKREVAKTEPKREAPRPVEKVKKPAAPKLELTSIRSNPPSKEERRNASERRIIEATREAQRREAPRPVEKRVQSSYLQVGAFAKRSNADNVANSLRRNGFSVSLRNEQGLTKVFVGPVPENQIKSMQQRLSRAGHESRRVN